VKEAQSQYDLAKADKIKSINTLQDSLETLATISGVHYTSLAPLKQNFPFTNPDPADINSWVSEALKTNWNLASQRLTTVSDRDAVIAQAGNMLPQVSFEATYARAAYSGNSFAAAGLNSGTDRSVALTFTWNIFQAEPVAPSTVNPGLLWSLTAQSQYTYEAQQANEDATTRQLISQVRQDYLSVLADVKSVNAYKQAVISGAAALDQAEAQYRVGTVTVTDVLNQVQYLYQDKLNYSAAQYQYINDFIQLRLDSGGLDVSNLASINTWLQS
jgi:outer membrane protein